MKIQPPMLFTRFAALPVVVAALLAVTFQSYATGSDYASRISEARLFKKPLNWVGDKAPDPEETLTLYQAAGLDQNQKQLDVIMNLESFIQTHPASAWTPSLRANLAVYYRSEGRYSLALNHWQEAWKAVQKNKDQKSRQLAEYVVAYWSQLLSNLGRLEELENLLAAVNPQLVQDAELRKHVDTARQAVDIMKFQPEMAFRCGTLALYHVAEALNQGNDCKQLVEMSSPKTGFSLARLGELSQQYGIGLVSVRRNSGNELVVPSVVHWNESHYAAIVEKQNGAYKVIDPTFGRPRWLSRDVINENASGYFMVPSNSVPSGWKIVGKEIGQTVFGKGLWNGAEPPPSGPPCQTCPPGCPPGTPGSPGSSGSEGCKTGCKAPGFTPTFNLAAGKAMPVWEVQEPFISLWLHDRPLFYTTSFGEEFGLDMRYHQRETRGVNNDIFNFGPWWNCNWLSYIQVEGNVTVGYEEISCYNPETYQWEMCIEQITSGMFAASEYASGGGVRTYTWGGPNLDNRIDVRTYTRLDTTESLTWFTNSINGTDYPGYTKHFQTAKLLNPNGSEVEYGLVVTTSLFPEEKIAMLTSIKDPQGRLITYHYSTNAGQILLTHIVDCDGKTNQLLYGNASFPTAVTQITNAAYQLNVSFRYDTNGFLTNIVDVAGISSSFEYTYTTDLFFTGYDSNGNPAHPDQYGNYTLPPTTNHVWLLTKLSTPYGPTTFDYFHPTWRLFTPSGSLYIEAFINRAITVTQPDGGKHLFLYHDLASQVSTAPGNTPAHCDWVGDAYAAQFARFYDLYFFDSHIGNNNSFYWGPRQYAALSTTVLTNLTYTDYTMARIRNWMHSEPSLSVLAPSQVLNAEQEPRPDAYTEGSSVWYGYEGKAWSHLTSTNTGLPSVIGRRTADDGSHRIENIWRNSMGMPTQVVEFGADGLCNKFVKTNLYLYAANEIDLLKHIGPDGTVLESFAYNSYHQPLFMTNAVGEVTAYTYNANRQLTSISRPSGLITTNIYGTDGFLAQTYDYAISGGSPVYYGTNSYTYAKGLVHTHTDERGLIITNTWDNLQRLTKVAYPDGTSMTYAYDKLDLTRVIDRMGFTNSFVHDSMRRKVFETNALGRVTAYNYCACGSLDSIRDAAGTLTEFLYDTAGRLTNTAYADGFSISQAYNYANQVLRTKDSFGKEQFNSYDGEGNLKTVMVSDPSYSRLLVAEYDYDIYDRMITNRDANGIVTSMTYDVLGRLRTRSYPDGGSEKFGYTLNVPGMTSYTNQLNDVTRYVYDPAGRKIAETNANLEVTQFTYNAAGDLLTLRDGKNQVTSWNYDSFGRVTNKVDNLSNLLFLYKYDPNNRLTNRWSAAKGNTAYRYDPVGNLTNVDYAVSTDIQLRYDVLNRLTNMVDAAGSTRYSYDTAGQLLSEDGPWSDDTVSYTYQHRLRTSLSVSAPNAGAWVQTYGYDQGRRLTSLSSPAGAFGYEYTLRNLGYDPYLGYDRHTAGTQVRALTLPSGAAITNDFDVNGRMLSTRLLDTDSVILNLHEYSYNAGNQRTQQVFAAGNYTDYGYDKIGQLKTAKAKESGGVTNRLNEQFTYMYDTAGNLTLRQQNSFYQNFTLNSLNQVVTNGRFGSLTVAGAMMGSVTNVTVNGLEATLYADHTFARASVPLVNAVTNFLAVATDTYGRMASNAITVNLETPIVFGYDLNGNMLSNGRMGFEYDDENQLVRVTATNAWKSEFTYDGKMRRRIRKEYVWSSGNWQLANEVRYVYDGNLVIQERDANNLPQVTYTRGKDLSGSQEGAGGIGGLLARTENSKFITQNSDAHAYYSADGNGNVTCLISSNEVVVARYHYDPFGSQLSAVGSLAEANLYRFSSKEFHPNSGLVYYLYRYYEPSLQRWVNRDPIQEDGGLNLYSFVQNHPVDAVDLFGLAISDKEYDECLKKAAKNFSDCMNLPCKIANKAFGNFGGALNLLNRLRRAALAPCRALGPIGYVACAAAASKLIIGPVGRILAKGAAVAGAAVVGWTAGCAITYAAEASACSHAYLDPPPYPVL